ncbi:MAG: hypothetical protein ACYTG1_12590 [Planctomycetota bacterium]|jgi:hypothetical protein
MSTPNITNEVLLAFAAGELDGTAAERAEAHLAGHPEAARSVALYRLARSAMAGDDTVAPPAAATARAKAIFEPRPDARPDLLARLGEIVATLVFDSRAQPATAGYRGRTDDFQLAFRSPEGEIDLEARRTGPAERAGAGPEWRLLGQVSTGRDHPTIAVALVPAGTGDVTTHADGDEHGVFTLDADPGRYDIVVRVDDTAIVLQDIEIE